MPKRKKTVKQLRLEHKLKQKDLADLLKLSRSGYSDKETGRRKFQLHEAIKLSALFDTDITDIIDFLPDDTRKAYQKIKSA